MRLHGRHDERAALGRLLAGARGGQGGVLVLRGQAGVGKTALLDDMAEAAADLRVIRAAGVESEMEIAFAALHQLCVPVLDRLEHLPGPRRDALGVAFGLKTGPAPDRFLVGLAALSLLTEAAAGAPLVCLVDNAQWLDRASRQALAFAARRLPAGPVLMVLAMREPLPDLSGLPELEVKGLREADARALLTSVTRWPLDEGVRNRIVAEARGNPRTLLAVPRAQAAGDLGLLDAQPLRDRALPDQAGPGWPRELGGLPGPARLLLVIAAAEPAGDPALVWRAATRLGVPAAAAQPAVQAGLVAFGARVTFRHPLARSAAYRSVPPRDRQRVHRALAEVTDPQADPDRHAWHLAQAAAGPDEQVAAELERAAGRAQARGVLATAAAFGEHAAALTPDPARRAGRALTGADAMVWAGAPDAALGLLALAESGPLDASQQARAALVHAKLAFASDRGSDAPPLLLEAARRLEPHDAALAQVAYLDALHAAMFAGHLARPGTGAREVALAARAAWPGRGTGTPDPFGLLLDGLAAHFGQGPTAGLPVLRRALRDFSGTVLAGQGLTGLGLTGPEPACQELRWLRLAGPAARHAWDDQAWDALSGRYLRLARDAGSLSELPLALSRRAYLHLFSGDLAAAASLVDETPAASELTGGSLVLYGALGLAAVRGRDDEARALIETVGKDAASRGEGTGVTAAKWASAVLGNGLGRYADALTAAGQAGQHPDELGLATWSQVELIEAAVRAGQPGRAADALGVLSEATGASGTDWALGVEARSRALLADGDDADSLYRDAIDRLAATRMRVDLARANLLYGEWLRRASRRVEAREQLRNAYESFTRMGAEAFAERARRELAATGETVRKRAAETEIVLTAQEGLIARLAGENHTNPQIAAELFISARTVEYHLAKVFAKLEISSRRELPTALRKLGLATTAT